MHRPQLVQCAQQEEGLSNLSSCLGREGERIRKDRHIELKKWQYKLTVVHGDFSILKESRYPECVNENTNNYK